MPEGERRRLDVELVRRGLAESRSKAQEMLAAGLVTVDGRPAAKAALPVDAETAIVCAGAPRYVGRGGDKLEKAMAFSAVSPQDKICLDVGASTGGFTDCMLQHGAKKVYAVDVGSGQLHERLRRDPRVVCMEKTDIRDTARVGENITPGEIGLCTVDVSFISLRQVLPAVWPYLADGGCAVCLVKPQFEAGRRALGRSGVVRDRGAHRQVLRELWDFWHEQGCRVLALTHSPITGGDGNIEYLAVLSRSAQETVPEQTLRTIVDAAFDAMKNNKR